MANINLIKNGVLKGRNVGKHPEPLKESEKPGRVEAFDTAEIDRFTVDDPNYVVHTIIGDNESVVKVAKTPGMGYQWKLVALDPATKKPVTLMSGTFLGTVHEYEDLVNMDPAEALAMISRA